MRIFLLTLLLVVLTLIGFACGEGNTSTGSQNGDSPTNSYKQLYAAVKAKNLDAIKQQMSKNSLTFAEAVSQQQKTPIEKVFENGFTATTFSEKLPEIRDERIDGTNGAVEVWNSKESRWEDLPYVKEETGWKLAVGDLFKGTWKSPGKGRAVREMEAANAINGGAQMAPIHYSNTSSNSNVIQKIVPNPESNIPK